MTLTCVIEFSTGFIMDKKFITFNLDRLKTDGKWDKEKLKRELVLRVMISIMKQCKIEELGINRIYFKES